MAKETKLHCVRAYSRSVISLLLINEVEAVVVIAGEQLRSDNKTNVQRTAHVSVDH